MEVFQRQPPLVCWSLLWQIGERLRKEACIQLASSYCLKQGIGTKWSKAACWNNEMHLLQLDNNSLRKHKYLLMKWFFIPEKLLKQGESSWPWVQTISAVCLVKQSKQYYTSTDEEIKKKFLLGWKPLPNANIVLTIKITYIVTLIMTNSLIL